MVRYTLLNASWFGVPQTSERMFLIGIHEELDADVVFPSPTHHSVLPPGYEGTRATARKLIPEINGSSWLSSNTAIAGSVIPSEIDGLPTDNHRKPRHSRIFLQYTLWICLKCGKLDAGRKDPAEPVSYTSATTHYRLVQTDAQMAAIRYH